MTDAPQTYGQQAVGVSFNPSGILSVDSIKEYYATIIDMLDIERDRVDDGEAKRLYSIAITDAQTACMWAVKALTWKA